MYKIDTVCQNIECLKPLTSYEIKRQEERRRSWRYRFCRHCRQIPDRGRVRLIWRCRMCPTLLDRSHSVRGQYYCKICARRQSIRMSKIKRVSAIG